MSYVAFRLELTVPPRQVSVDVGVKALLGFSAQDFLTATVHLKDLVHKGDTPLAASLFSSEAQKKSGIVRLRLRKADGKIVCVRAQFQKEASSNGPATLELQLADARTVTEPGDAALVNSFKSLIEQSTDYIYIKNRNHVILAASRMLPSLIETNGGRIELVGTTDYDNHPEETADIYYELEEQAFGEGRRTNLIHQVPRKDGTARWIDNRKYPINGPDGEFIGIFGVAPDITEYIEAQNRLRASEESLRDAQEIAGLSSYVLDIPKQHWQVSPELAELVGIGEAYGREFEGLWLLIHPDDRPAMAERLQAYFKGERSGFDSEYRILRHTDGAVRWVHTRGRLEVDEHGNPQFLRGTVLDITDRKVAEVALKENEEVLREAQQIAGLGSYVLDIPKMEWTVSPEVLKLIGSSSEPVNGFDEMWMYIHPDDRGWVAKRFEGYFRGEGSPFDLEYRVVRGTDGKTRWIHTRGRLEFDASGRPVTLRGTIQDVTERKETEATLREHEEALHEAQRIAGLGIHVQDLSSGASSASEILKEILGIDPREDLSSEGWKALVHPEDREIVDACFAVEALQKTQQFDLEHRIIRRNDGAVRWVHARGRIERDKSGTPLRLRGIVQDITSSKEADTALRENRELLRLFIEHAPVALAMFDMEMRYIAVSRRWTESTPSLAGT